MNLRRVRWFTQGPETEVMTYVTEEWRRTDTQALKTHGHCRHADATDTQTLPTQRGYRYTDATDTLSIQTLQTKRRSRHTEATDTADTQDAPGHL